LSASWRSFGSSSSSFRRSGHRGWGLIVVSASRLCCEVGERPDLPLRIPSCSRGPSGRTWTRSTSAPTASCWTRSGRPGAAQGGTAARGNSSDDTSSGFRAMAVDASSRWRA
jgi:hypothetical protein